MKKGVKKRELNINPNLAVSLQKPGPLSGLKAVDHAVFESPALKNEMRFIGLFVSW